MSNYVSETSDNSFETDVLQSEQPVLVDFWAEWCGPCRMIAPTIEAVAEKYHGKAKMIKLNVDENKETARRFGIRGIPTLILFKGGKEEDRIVGAASREAISDVVEKHIFETAHR
jgi:thioredoxin 1